MGEDYDEAGGGSFDAAGGPGAATGFFASTRSSPRGSQSYDASGERYSRKVFVGGLPPDIDEGIMRRRPLLLDLFRRFFFRFNKTFFAFGFQTKLRRVSVASARWWSTGLTKPRASLTSRPRATPSCFFRCENV
jgi:hypothetical protein